MRVIEFLLVGALVVMMLAVGFSFGRFYEREIRPRAETVIERVGEINLPLVPEVPDR